MTPPAVFPDKTDPTKGLEDEAYQAVEDAAEEDGTAHRSYRGYAHLGPALYDRPYRAGVLGEWPVHTDFRPDELVMRD